MPRKVHNSEGHRRVYDRRVYDWGSTVHTNKLTNMPGDSGDSVGRRCGTEGPGGPTLPRAYSQGLLGDGWDLSIGLMVADETRGPLATACAKAKKPAIVASTTEHDIVSSVTLASAVITATKAAAFAAAAAPTGTNIGFGATVASRATNLWCADATPFHRTSEHHARLRGAANDGFGGACTHAKGRGSGGISCAGAGTRVEFDGRRQVKPVADRRVCDRGWSWWRPFCS
mmetsp:Transcript_32278/g.84818  ORF Transcript_32278/g.84818 Transcript_32278/m.84818 type:complete len:229 (-) Transcript_32278:60-746(-)